MVASSYPLFKRFFPLPQAYLAIAFSFAFRWPFAAVHGRITPAGWWLFAANLFWVVAYDTEYAMVDRDRRRAHWYPLIGDPVREADVAAVMGCYALYLGLMLVAWLVAAAGLAILCRLDGRSGLRRLPLQPDPQPGTRRLLPRVSATTSGSACRSSWVSLPATRSDSVSSGQSRPEFLAEFHRTSAGGPARPRPDAPSPRRPPCG